MRPGNIVVRTGGAGDVRSALSDLVLAWARDIESGEPRYIMELGPERRGAKCGCECTSCGLPLTAVNAAKTDWRKRPHFRHPEGAVRTECLVLAARVAVLRHLHEDGWLELPRRRMRGQAVGLSGRTYEAWVEAPPERVRVLRTDFRDRAAAVLTLDDGRQLRVELTGTGAAGARAVGEPGLQDALVPTIWLDVDDPSLAGMEPDELRRRLTLLPGLLCWRAHWADAELAGQAAADARAQAQDYLDELPDGLELPAGLDAVSTRETVLHHEVKQLLMASGRLRVPGLDVAVEAQVEGGSLLRGRWRQDALELALSRVVLEKRFGHIVPDVACTARSVAGREPEWTLFVEVTVTNHVDAERLGRVRQTGQATLEIDLSLTGGRVTRDELRQLVIEELGAKRWLFHPEAERQRAALQSELAQQAEEERLAFEAHARAKEERRRTALATPLSQVCQIYLLAVEALAGAEVARATRGAGANADAATADGVRAARVKLNAAVHDLGVHGHPGAGDASLIGHQGVVLGMVSVQRGRSLGSPGGTLISRLEAVEAASGAGLAEHPLYLLALKAFLPPLTEPELEWCEAWARRVRASIRAGEWPHLRHPPHAALLSVLFPEMAEGLAKLFGRLALPGNGPPHPRPGSGSLPEQGRTSAPSGSVSFVDRPLLDTRLGEKLRGRDLEAWKRAHPEWAKAWFEGRDSHGDGPEGGGRGVLSGWRSENGPFGL